MLKEDDQKFLGNLLKLIKDPNTAALGNIVKIGPISFNRMVRIVAPTLENVNLDCMIYQEMMIVKDETILELVH